MAVAEPRCDIHQPWTVSAALLRNLEEAHERLFSEIASMDALTQKADVDWPIFCATRWRISEASLVRRTLAARIVDHLAAQLRDSEQTLLRSLKAADQEMLRISAEHVRLWSLKAIQDNWTGYCRDSRVIRSRMTAYLKSEQQVLFPMLRRAYLGSSQSSDRLTSPDDNRIRLVR